MVSTGATNFSHETFTFLQNNLVITSDDSVYWPSISTYLTSLDNVLCAYVKNQIYKISPQGIREVKEKNVFVNF